VPEPKKLTPEQEALMNLFKKVSPVEAVRKQMKRIQEERAALKALLEQE
jgi:hypothetical protein